MFPSGRNKLMHFRLKSSFFEMDCNRCSKYRNTAIDLGRHVPLARVGIFREPRSTPRIHLDNESGAHREAQKDSASAVCSNHPSEGKFTLRSVGIRRCQYISTFAGSDSLWIATPATKYRPSTYTKHQPTNQSTCSFFSENPRTATCSSTFRSILSS